MDTINILADESIGTINPNIYGHFAEHIGGVIYDGIWVGPDSLIENIHGFRKGIIDALEEIRPPVIRWPGGCFAETYDWRDGIGPVTDRPTTANWWHQHDGRYETNAVGTHEFAAFCRIVGAEPYFAANITSTTPLEIRNWIEYCTFPRRATSLARLREKNGDPDPLDIKYWGIGNENWGGGGNMTPEDYATEFRKYVTVGSNAGGPGRCYIACGPNGNDTDWTVRFFKKMADRISDLPKVFQGYAAHYYCGTTGHALEFTRDEWYQLLSRGMLMERLVVQQRATMDTYDPDRNIGLVVDEWGCWHPDGSGPSKGENLFEQQSTMRDAMVAAITLNIFNNHCDKVVMANVAQLVNNLHSLFLSRGDCLVRTPNFDVFAIYKEHQGGRAIRTIADCETIPFVDGDGHETEVPAISQSASIKDGKLTLTLANLRFDAPAEIRINVYPSSRMNGPGKKAVLQAEDPHDYNTFEAPDRVRAVRSDIEAGTTLPVVDMPAASIVTLELPVGG